jgi:hypothetical protein
MVDNALVMDSIRRIESNGQVTTFSGEPGNLGATDGDAKTARFGFPV